VCLAEREQSDRDMTRAERERFAEDLHWHRPGEPYPLRWTPELGLLEISSLDAWDAATHGRPHHEQRRR
jgi:hypothetical protein